MKNSILKFLIFFTIATFLWTCKVPYYPPVNAKQTNFLVVEGYITAITPTVIKLTHTRVVSQYDTARALPETGANLVVEDDHGDRYPLTESGAGIYTMGIVSLDSTYKYSLYISTSSGKEYQSDYVPFESSPPIIGIDQALKQGDLQIYVNTQNQDSHSRYYRWAYQETWEYHTPYFSGFEYFPATDSLKVRIQPVHICWVTEKSSTVVIGSSVGLQDNIIHSPLAYFPDHDRRLSVLYSVLITQYVLDSAAYKFWQAMKGNSEDLGFIFSTQPNQTRGNVHNISDSSETVIGYVGAGNTTQYRGFIYNNSLPASWNQPTKCVTIFVPEDSFAFYFGAGLVPLYHDFQHGKKGYDGSFEECADCTFLGTTTKPSFWP
ncbi:MAG: DUF4249 domain-containing protein [Ginsengibacter sp.]